MLKMITVEEAQNLIRRTKPEEYKAINIQWSTDTDSLLRKVKLVNSTFGSKVELRTKSIPGLIASNNDLVSFSRKCPRSITFICVPEKNFPYYVDELNHSDKDVYLVS